MDLSAVCSFVVYCSTLLSVALAADTYGQDGATGDSRPTSSVSATAGRAAVPDVLVPPRTSDAGASRIGVRGGVVTAQSGGAARVSSPNVPFEPAPSGNVIYGNVPNVPGSVLTISGPMTAPKFLESLSLATQWNIVTTPKAAERTLQFWLTNLTPKQAVEVLKYNGLHYSFDANNDFLRVMTLEERLELNHGALESVEFNIQHADINDAETVLNALKSGRGQLVVVPRSSKIIAFDTHTNLQYMREALQAIDRPNTTTVIQLRHVDAEFIADSIGAMLSERGELRVDPRSNAVIVSDRDANTERIQQVVRVLDQELETRTWALNYIDPEEVAERIEDMVPTDMGSISVNEDLRQVSAKATPHRLDEIEMLIGDWDRQRRQVQIEAYLLAASRNVARDIGVRWGIFGMDDDDPIAFQFGNANSSLDSPPAQGQSFSIGQLPGLETILDPISGEPITNIAGDPVISGLMGSDVSVVVDYLETTGDVTILAHPRVTVQDGEEAVFENTTSVPFAQATELFERDRDGDLRSVTQIEFVDVGTILRVSPQISSDDSVVMDVVTEESTFQIVTVRAADLVNDVPQTTQNKAQTQVRASNEETIVIGGLRTSNFTDNVDKVPLLGDIPIFGRLFRASSKRNDHAELLIFITPTIVDGGTHPEAAKLAQHDAEFAETMRFDRLNDFGKVRALAGDGEDAITIAIGQRGDLYVHGEWVEISALAERVAELNSEGTREAVIRSHPRAPQAVKAETTAVLVEAGLDFRFDDATIPFVPRIPEQ